MVPRASHPGISHQGVSFIELALPLASIITGDDGVTRMVRSCVEGPVFRGDRVRWSDVGTVPADTLGAPTGGH